MVRRRWILRTLLAAAILLFLAVTVALLSLPRLLHTVAVWRLEAMTKRPVTIEAIEFRLRTARFSVRGLRVTDHDGSPFLTVQSLEGRLHRRSLLQGQVWIEDVALTGGDVRIVRTGPDRFNISDLLTSKEPSTGFALTVDHLLLQGVSVVVEDRVLSPPRTWRADDIRLEATSLGTAAPRGVAFASATVAGALLSVRVMNIQLYPLHLNAEANIRDLDLTLADLYMPPDSPVMVESGVVHAAVSLDMDAKAGLTLDAEGVVEQLAVGRLDVAGDEVTSPAVRFLVRELQQKTGTVGLRYASLEGDVTVIDPTTSPPTPLKLKDVIATVSNLQEGLKGSAGVALYGTLPGVGEVDVSGSAGLAPPRADVRVRARSINLGFLSHYLPLEARMSGVGTADLRVVATQDRTLAVTVTGDVTLDKVTVADEEQTPVTVKRIAARGFAYTYPATVRVADLALTEPSTLVERAADGTLNLAAIGRLRPPPPGAPVPSAPAASAAAVTPDVAVRRLSVVRGRARVTDNVVNSRVEVSALELTAEDLTWPSKGPARVRLSTDVAGARLGARGTVDLGPRRGILAVTARKIDLATLQPWLPPAAGQLRGTAEADVTLTLGLQPLSVEARGTVNGARLSWTDGVHPTVNLATLDVKAEDDVTWPSKGPARVRVVSDVAGGRVAAHGTVNLGPRHTNLTVNARRVDLAAAQPWLPAGTVLRGTADADVTLALGLEPLSVEAKGAVTGAKLAYTDGKRPTVNLATLDVRADENVTWPSKGPARVRVAVEVAGGRIGARGPVDIGARKGDLAIKVTSVDLAALQPWLPIVGQIRGAGDADIEVSVGLEPFTLALKGRLGAGNLAFLEGTKPLITVTRVDATGIDLVWPTKVSIDRLHVNTPWAEVARNRQGELSLRALFRRRPDLPRPAQPAPDTGAAAPGPLPGMQVTLREAIFENGGGRIIDDNVEPAARFDLAGSHLELRNVSWPSRGAANVLFSTPMPGSGTLKARGTFSIEPTKLALDAELDQVDLAPGRPYLPFNARVAGKLTGKAKLNGAFDDTIALVIDGDAVVDRLRIGDADRRLVTADKVDLAGFRYSFPTSVRIRETTLTKPWMLIERHSDGTVELVELFKARHGLPTKAENVSIPPPSAK
ncbi:MAG TPA: DUF748 domain-containing protein, partial [Methylomirabilota bacterium]|nr:DUF748 domain-containing protein [Methylomirabilota bacterium]